jgi:hypothetical protein
VDAVEMMGEDPHGIGGIMSEWGKIVCTSCQAEREAAEYEYERDEAAEREGEDRGEHDVD